MKQKWQLYRWGTKSQRNYMTFYMTYAHKINNHSYWQVQALHASVVSSLALSAALICEKFRFYERTYELRVQIFFSSLHFYSWCTHSVQALCTSRPSPGYRSVEFLSSGTEAPWLKLLRFWLLARSLSRTASSWSSHYPLFILLSFVFMLACFHPLRPFLIHFLSACLFAVSPVWSLDQVSRLCSNISLPSAIHFVLSPS